MSRPLSTDSTLRGSCQVPRRALLACPSFPFLSRTAAAQAGWLQQTDPFSRVFREALEASDFQVRKAPRIVLLSESLMTTALLQRQKVA